MRIKIILQSIIFSCFILFTSSIKAQTGQLDELLLKNGSIIKGTIIENSTDIVKIKTSDGREYVFNKPEVESITQNGQNIYNTKPIETNNDKPFVGKEVRKRYTPPKKGFWLSGEIQLLSPPSINIVAGYKIHQFAYIGLGTGIHNYTEYNFSNLSRPFTGTIIPIYVRYSGDILNRRVTPFYSLEAGYGIAVSNGPLFINYDVSYLTNGYTARDIQVKGGAYGALTFGFKVRTNKNVSFGAGFTYRLQSATASESIDLGGGATANTFKYQYLNQRFGLKLIFIGFN